MSQTVRVGVVVGIPRRVVVSLGSRVLGRWMTIPGILRWLRSASDTWRAKRSLRSTMP